MEWITVDELDAREADERERLYRAHCVVPRWSNEHGMWSVREQRYLKPRADGKVCVGLPRGGSAATCWCSTTSY